MNEFLYVLCLEPEMAGMQERGRFSQSVPALRKHPPASLAKFLKYRAS